MTSPNILLRRKRLGATSCAGIEANSKEGIKAFLNSSPDLPTEASYLFRWGCTSTFRPRVEEVNSPEAIHLASDKASSRQVMSAAGVNIPPTYYTLARAHSALITTGAPIITRPNFHHQGRLLFKSTTARSLRYSTQRCGGEGNCYHSLFIPKVAEYRIYVIQGRVACVAEKSPLPGKVAWNKAKGGSFHNVKWGSWPLEACREGILSVAALGLDFGGADVIVDESGQSYVLEVNAAPSLTSPYRQRCFAVCFDYMVAYGKGKIPVGDLPSWKSLIHPAVKEDDGE